MRKHEIEEAMESGTTLALMPDGISGPASQVKVVSMTGTRQVPTPGLRMYRTHSAPGITVAYVGKNDELGKEVVVASVKLVGTWHDYQMAEEAKEAAEATKEERLSLSEMEAEEAAANVRSYLKRSGVEYGRDVVEVVGVGGGYRPRGGWSAPRAYAVRLAPAIVNRLVLAAPVKGSRRT